MKLNKQQKEDIKNIIYTPYNTVYLSLDLGKKIGAFCLASNKSSPKLLNFNGVIKSENFLNGLFKHSHFINYLNSSDKKYLLLITADPYIKNIKTNQYLIKQEAIIEYVMKICLGSYPATLVNDIKFYRLKLNESTVNAWMQKTYKEHWSKDISTKENKYKIVMTLFKDSFINLKEDKLELSYEAFNHVTDAFCLYWYYANHDTACNDKITPFIPIID